MTSFTTTGTFAPTHGASVGSQANNGLTGQSLGRELKLPDPKVVPVEPKVDEDDDNKHEQWEDYVKDVALVEEILSQAGENRSHRPDIDNQDEALDDYCDDLAVIVRTDTPNRLPALDGKDVGSLAVRANR